MAPVLSPLKATLKDLRTLAPNSLLGRGAAGAIGLSSAFNYD
jgi:hypothetical protein